MLKAYEEIMSECPRNGWLAGTCKFEPRYDISEPLLPANTTKISDPEMAETFKRKTYVRDVCVRCGRTIERTGK